MLKYVQMCEHQELDKLAAVLRPKKNTEFMNVDEVSLQLSICDIQGPRKKSSGEYRSFAKSLDLNRFSY